MSSLKHIADFELHWETLNHLDHPYGDTMWHLFWGVVSGASLVYAIVVKDFLFLIISLFGAIFFFHPVFYEEEKLSIVLNKEGVFINKRFHPWTEFEGFEIFETDHREYLYFLPKTAFRFGFGIMMPLSDYTPLDKVRTTLRQFLDEYEDSLSYLDRWYVSIFR
ncbi:MAG: hypothetical protein UU76_C0003G0004 [Parcubacteria group bacterium GW2011_GWC1_41_7]|nr:MAG: hypothetical protein UU76_C0003G0004 [Parcubacteria group bacterium GW2011_GWC1_41_7]